MSFCRFKSSPALFSFFNAFENIWAVDCGPYCTPVPQAGAGYYPNVFMTESLQMSPIQTLLQMPELHSADQQQQQQQRNIDLHEFSHNNVNGCSPLSIETLQLFPLHPTGIINEADRSAGSSLTSVSVESDDHSLEGEEVGGENSKPPHFFSFFGWLIDYLVAMMWVLIMCLLISTEGAGKILWGRSWH